MNFLKAGNASAILLALRMRLAVEYQFGFPPLSYKIKSRILFLAPDFVTVYSMHTFPYYFHLKYFIPLKLLYIYFIYLGATKNIKKFWAIIILNTE